MPIKYRSLESTSNLLQTFFSKSLSDMVATDEIYEIWGRTTTDEQKNKAWLSSTMMHLKHHDLVTPVYGRKNHRNALIGLKLTDKGKSILGRKNVSSHNFNSNQQQLFETNSLSKEKIDYKNMMKLIAEFQKENPQFKVEFSIKLKEEN